MRRSGLGGDLMRIRVLIAVLALMAPSSAGAAVVQSFETTIDCDAAQRQADSGDAAAYVDLGLCHLRGEGREPDVKTGLAWLRKGVAGGDTDAMVELGNLYFDGADGVAADRRAAMKLYARAAALGDPNAMYNLGVLNEGGGGAPARPRTALSWFLKSAEAGSARGAFAAGEYYLDGYGARVDVAKGVLMLQRAIEMGSPEAMNSLGHLHAKGRGVPRDEAKALRLYTAAANNDLAAGMSSLGVAHHNGEGAPVN